MTMQRRHFELIAETIASVDDSERYADSVHPEAKRTFAYAFANKLRATNPNFNRDRFLRACGVE